MFMAPEALHSPRLVNYPVSVGVNRGLDGIIFVILDHITYIHRSVNTPAYISIVYYRYNHST